MTDAKSKAPKKGKKPRVDEFRGARPYYGVRRFHEKVPPLFMLCSEVIVKTEMDYGNIRGLPPVLKSRLDHYRKYEDYKGPKISKCSVCQRFFSNPEKFKVHECSS